MIIDLNLIAQICEIGTAISTIPFIFLSWASGYIALMVRAARKRGWGFGKGRHVDILDGMG